MRIVCDACDARYAIDNARLSGRKTFKVRCRRCGQMIVVKSASGTQPRWHLVVRGDEVGPLTTSEVIAGVDTGDLHGATLVWREGLADWRRLSEVDELRDCLAAVGAQTPAPKPEHAGLFDAPAAQPEDEGGVTLTASRNESSVLFSIANLRALAESSPRQVESGLIDIHALAPPTVSADHESTLYSSYATAAAPLLVPEERRRARWLVPALAGVGAALLTTTVVLVIVVTLGERSEAAAPAAPPTKVIAPAPKRPAQPGVTPRPAPELAPAVKEAPKRKVAPHRRNRRRSRRAKAKTNVRSEQRVVAKAPKRKREKEKDVLGRLIDDATKPRGGNARTAAEKAKVADLPTSLEHRQINTVVQGLRPRVRACFDRYRVPGTADMRLTISPRGRLDRAVVRGRFAGTPTGACLRQAFMTARFPRFSGPPFSVTYPVFLR